MSLHEVEREISIDRVKITEGAFVLVGVDDVAVIQVVG